MLIRRKIKTKSRFIQYKSNKLDIIWILCIFAIVFMLMINYIKYMKILIYKNVYQNIAELSEQTATQLNLSITDQKSVLHLMVETINQGHLKTEQEIFNVFKDTLDNYHFTRLVILDRNGNGITSDNYEVKNYPNMQEFFNHEHVYLSENRPSTVSDNQVNIYSHVFNINGKEKVLMATINTSDYKEILLRRLFGKGGTYLINNNGTVLIDSFDNIKESNANFYEYVKTTYNIEDEESITKIDKMEAGIKNNEEGTFDLEVGPETYFLHYERVGINDWYVITTASDGTIAKELMNLVIMSAILCLIVICIIECLSIYISVSNQRKNKKIYKVAYIDPITLLGNETYFKVNGTIFLEGKTAKNKYIITVDINKFKALNNIYGYAFCNNILKMLGHKIKNILPADNITCRMSNDIFASIFTYDEDIKELLDRLFKEASILNVEGKEIHVNLAIGAYNILPDEIDINILLDKAYLARAQIKGLYHNNYYLFDEKLENQMIEEQKLESSMEEALENKEFIVYYQPKTYTKNEKMSGAEALIRWKKGDKLIPPRKIYSFI